MGKMSLLKTIPEGGDLGVYPTWSDASSIIRKQAHNAYERDRRKKINALYTCLRSLLPQSQSNKKLSIPNTVARVLDYVTELQRQVERLEQRKEEIVARMRMERDLFGRSSERRSPLVCVADLGCGEVAIQVCALSRIGNKGMMSAVMEYLDYEGLFTVSASTIAVESRRMMLSLHCQVRNASVKLDPETLRRNLPAMLR